VCVLLCRLLKGVQDVLHALGARDPSPWSCPQLGRPIPNRPCGQLCATPVSNPLQNRAALIGIDPSNEDADGRMPAVQSRHEL
jgi:hypothetical protein